jgi:hypothetical protein
VAVQALVGAQELLDQVIREPPRHAEEGGLRETVFFVHYASHLLAHLGPGCLRTAAAVVAL